MTRTDTGWTWSDEDRIGYVFNGGERLTDPDD
jgi:hypothetical protein